MNPENKTSSVESPRGTQRPRFSILHTSARPDKWRAVYDSWLAAADRPEDVEYVLVVDERWGFKIDPTVNAALQLHMDRWAILDAEPLDKAYDLGWDYWKKRRCYVEGVNFAAEHATGDILITVADDQFPCEHWDAEIVKALPLDGGVKTNPFVLWAPTGTPSEFERSIIVMPIISRALYEKWGYVMYPGYESMCADNDLCEHARAEGVLIEARHLPVFPHRHFLFTPGVPVDEAYNQQNRAEAYAIGERLLNARRANGFKDVTANPPTPIRHGNQGPAGSTRQSIAVCLPGETFSQSYVVKLMDLLFFLAQHFNLRPYWCFSSSPDHTRQQLRQDVLKDGVPDFVLWIDDDQLLSVDGLKLLLEDLREHPDISLAAGWSWEASNENKPPMISAGCFVDPPAGFKSQACGRIEHSTLMSLPGDLTKVEWTGFPAVLMRGSLLVEAGDQAFIMWPNDLAPFYRYGEDISFCMRLPHRLLVIDRRVRVPHLKLEDNEPIEIKALALKTRLAAIEKSFAGGKESSAHDVLQPAGVPA